MLTKQKLIDMKPHEVFACGIIKNNPEGIFITRNFPDRCLLWVAKRGEIPDWAIYIYWLCNDTIDAMSEADQFKFISEHTADFFTTIDYVLRHGDKVSERNILKLLAADEEAIALYRP